MANLFDNFYKQFKYAQMRRNTDLEAEYIADPIQDNDIKSMGDIESLSYYSASARSIIKFLSLAGLAFKYESLSRYSVAFYNRLVQIKAPNLRESFSESIKNDSDLQAFNSANNIDHSPNPTPNGQSVVAVNSIATDIGTLNNLLGDAADEPEMSTDRVSSNKLLASCANIGNAKQSGLSKNEIYFIFPDFHSGWIEKSKGVVSNIKYGEKHKNYQKIKTLQEKILADIQKAEALIQSSYQEKENYLSKVFQMKKESFYEKNNKKISKRVETLLIRLQSIVCQINLPKIIIRTP
jgi:hypothetical protein